MQFRLNSSITTNFKIKKKRIFFTSYNICSHIKNTQQDFTYIFADQEYTQIPKKYNFEPEHY